MPPEPTLIALFAGTGSAALYSVYLRAKDFGRHRAVASRPADLFSLPVHHTIVDIDVAGSGSRDDQLQLRMRADLRALVGAVLARQSLTPGGTVDCRDLGDGIRLVVPASVSPCAMLDPFIPNLATALREHRKLTAPAARLRLRVAVHTGLLHRDETGWAGNPLVLCARLRDAEPVRLALRAAGDRADLAVVVSQTVHDTVVRHGFGLDPDTYRQVTIREKETLARAWVHVPGFPAPPGLDADEPVLVRRAALVCARSRGNARRRTARSWVRSRRIDGVGSPFDHGAAAPIWK
jgi:hypothetical protein